MRIVHILRKPLSEGTVAANVLKHGAGGLNIDASRIARDGSHMVHGKVRRGDTTLMADRTSIGDGPGMSAPGTTFTPTNHAGRRWPANVILQHLDGCRCAGVKKVKGTGPRAGGSGSRFNDPGNLLSRKGHEGVRTNHEGHADKDGKETVANWICAEGCPVARLDEQSGVLAPQGGQKHKDTKEGSFLDTGFGGSPTSSFYGDKGGASRFFKQVGGTKDSG
jgi:hypothetical protein